MQPGMTKRNPREHVVVPVNGEKQGQSSNRLFSAGQIVHWSESLSGRHAVVIDAVQVRLLGIFWSQERLSTLVL